MPVRMIREHPGFRVAVGIHPKHTGKVVDAQVRRLKQLVASPGVAAMGEIGSGLHRGKSCTGASAGEAVWGVSDGGTLR